jgi:hypothetical protein
MHNITEKVKLPFLLFNLKLKMEQQPHESTLLKLAMKTATSLSTLQIKVNDENCNLPIHSSSSVVCRVLKPILSSSQQNSRLIQLVSYILYNYIVGKS